ncbi:hypothetical protein ACLBO7_28455, partial [Klebsiella pneumoniae]
MQTSKPALELLTSDAIYRENPTALFHQLCGARPATLLLESADIDSKDDLKSLLLVDTGPGYLLLWRRRGTVIAP